MTAAIIDGKAFACLFGLGLDLGANNFLYGGPVAVKGGDEIAGWCRRPILAAPRGSGYLLLGGSRVIIKTGKKLPPMDIHGGWVFQIFGVEPFNELGIATIEE